MKKTYIMNCLLPIAFSLSIISAASAATFTYDLTYDKSNRVTAVAIGTDQSITYEYRPNGQLERIVASATDSDSDGLSDALEDSDDCCLLSENPDTDGDGLWDGVEIDGLDCILDPDETNPCLEDTDGDGLTDGQEDSNLNGILDPGELNPLDSDSDDDGLTDGAEDANKNGSWDPGELNPLDPDSDDDGLTDGEEDSNKNGTLDPGELDPLDPDTDDDDYTDGFEATLGTNPLNGGSHPQIICIGAYEASECDSEAQDVNDGKTMMSGDAEAFYFWVRDFMIQDESFSIERHMLLDIESGGVTITQ